MSPRLLEKGDVQKEHPLTANSFSPRAKGRGEKVKAQKTVYCCLQLEDRIFFAESQALLQETPKPKKQATKARNHSNLGEIQWPAAVLTILIGSRSSRKP
jgi:hypothetical protein